MGDASRRLVDVALDSQSETQGVAVEVESTVVLARVTIGDLVEPWRVVGLL